MLSPTGYFNQSNTPRGSVVPGSSFQKYHKAYLMAVKKFKDFGINYAVKSNTIPSAQDILNFPTMLNIQITENYPIAIIRCIGKKKNPVPLNALKITSFTWNYSVAEYYGPNCSSYLFKPGRVSLFILNFKNLWILKQKMYSHVKKSNSEELEILYNEYCDQTGLGVTHRKRIDASHARYMQYSYTNKPESKVRLIDAGQMINSETTINKYFAVILIKFFNILGIKCSGFIYDPMLMNKGEQLGDYYLHEWNAEIVLFNPANDLIHPDDWFDKHRNLDRNSYIHEIHEKSMNYFAELIENFNTSHDLITTDSILADIDAI